MDISEDIAKRRSVRDYTGERIPPRDLQKIAEAGILAPSSRGRRPWEIVLCENGETLAALSRCRKGSGHMLEMAGAAFCVFADPWKSDVWIEDCSCVMAQMHLAASALGYGSCWIQLRGRVTGADGDSEEYVKSLLHVPAHFRAEAILAVGCVSAREETPRDAALYREKIHRETFDGNDENSGTGRG